MSDAIKHECGIALVRLKKPLQYYKDKYGSAFYGINKMYLLMEKQHNRGQDGAGFASVKFNVEPGTRYISRVRSNQSQPIQDIFAQINDRLNGVLKQNPTKKDDVAWQEENMPYVGNLFLGHVRYGTFGKNSIESVHPFLRQSNWKHQNLIVAGNFNMTNSKQLLEELVELGQHPKEFTDTVTVMEKIGHFLEEEVASLYQQAKIKGFNKKDASPFIEEKLDLQNVLKRSSKNWDGGYAMAGLVGHGDAFVLRDPNGIRPTYFFEDDEVVVVASERPVIQTVFNVKIDDVKELERGHALIIKKNGKTSIEPVLDQKENKACSFERIYFSRGSDAEIYQERKELGRLIMPKVLKEIDHDTEATDENIIAVLTKMVKQRKESIKMFTDGGRDELAAKEAEEVSALEFFLPQPLTNVEISELIKNAINDSGAASMADMGKVMAVLKPLMQGKADMGAVSGQVRAALNS